MGEHNALVAFQDKRIRRIWHDNQWYFSVVDVVGALSESVDTRNYWKVLKHRLIEEGSQVVTNCNQLKLPASDGKYYETDCANTETLFRLIQSVPSPKAEPFKLWLAKVGYERVQEIENSCPYYSLRLFLIVVLSEWNTVYIDYEKRLWMSLPIHNPFLSVADTQPIK